MSYIVVIKNEVFNQNHHCTFPFQATACTLPHPYLLLCNLTPLVPHAHPFASSPRTPKRINHPEGRGFILLPHGPNVCTICKEEPRSPGRNCLLPKVYRTCMKHYVRNDHDICKWSLRSESYLPAKTPNPLHSKSPRNTQAAVVISSPASLDDRVSCRLNL